MLRFCANLSLLFAELPLHERFAAAAKAGFRAVEIQFPYSLPAEFIRQELERHQLKLVLHNLPAGDWDAGERGIACDPARVAEFRAGVAHALTYARTLGVTRLNCLAGIAPATLAPEQAQAVLIDNLRYAADALHQHGMTLLLEAINTIDVPGFFVCRSRQMRDLLAEVNKPNLRMQYDIYHMTQMQEDVVADLEAYLPQIGHIQIADVPGRGEPGSGTIDWQTLFALLEKLGWDGWIGCEYKPQNGTLASLRWPACQFEPI